MPRLISLLVAITCTLAVFAEDDPAIFKSDVAMTRVDTQVVDSLGRPITGLQVTDFVLRVDGKVQPIRNFSNENMPVDILLLLDVSGSMEPHVQRIADASEQALRVLAPQDRMAVMVFDTRTKVRLPFNQDHGEIVSELHNVLRAERFNGGTRITHAMLDAARYIGRNGRADARRAIVILTDDETQDGENEPQVQVALDEANAVLSFLRAPYELPFTPGTGGQVPGARRGPWGGGGGTWGTGGPWGGTTWPGGPGGPIGGSRYPGGTTVGIDPSHSAGTAEIAKGSGGDVMPISDASAFQDTLERLRQRYALHFYWPAGSLDPEQRTVVVSLAHSTGARYLGSEVRYRRAYISNDRTRHAGGLIEVSREADPTDPEGARSSRPTRSAARYSATDANADSNSDQPIVKRRVAVNERSGPVVNAVEVQADGPPGKPAASPDSTSSPAAEPSSPPAKRGGWPRVDESKTQSAGTGPIVK
ncbi:MAG: VWA domain-containing protein [Bryobacteraceae bacterium]